MGLPAAKSQRFAREVPRGHDDDRGHLLCRHYAEHLADNVDADLVRSPLLALNEVGFPFLTRRMSTPPSAPPDILDHAKALPAIGLCHQFFKLLPGQRADRGDVFLLIESRHFLRQALNAEIGAESAK